MINPIGMLINTATVINPTESLESGTRAGKLSYGAGTSVACSLQPLSASESLRYGRDYPTTLARCYFPYGTVVRANARVVIGSDKWKALGEAHNVASRGAGTEGGMARVDLELEGPAA